MAPALLIAAPSPFAGRWDITVTTPRESYPGWMELVERGGKPEVRIQPRTGSVHPAAGVELDGAHLVLTVSAADTKAPALTWTLDVKGDKLTGVQQSGYAVSQLAGVRAPELKREPPQAWTNPEPLFDGKDLNGWEPTTPSDNHWVAQDGTLLNTKKGANIKTTRKFDDFKLHIEFNCPEGGNSGVYLRGRYEVQVEYEPLSFNDEFHRVGSIYGFIAPAGKLPRKPGAWESYRRYAGGTHGDGGSQRRHHHRPPGDSGNHRRRAGLERGRTRPDLYPGRSHGRDEVPQHHDCPAEALR